MKHKKTKYNISITDQKTGEVIDSFENIVNFVLVTNDDKDTKTHIAFQLTGIKNAKNNEIKGEEKMNAKELITTRFSEKKSVFTSKYSNELKDLIVNSTNGQILVNAFNQVNANLGLINTIGEIKYDFGCEVLTPTELEKANRLKEEFNKELSKLDTEQQELLVLFDLAETFDQKQTLLVRYGVLSD